MLITPIVDTPTVLIAQRPCADERIGVHRLDDALGGFRLWITRERGVDPARQIGKVGAWFLRTSGTPRQAGDQQYPK